MENYSASLSCINSECEEYGRKIHSWYDVGIGVKTAPFQKEDRHYAMVCECDKCFEQFWFHLPDNLVENEKEFFKDGLYKKAKQRK